MSRADYEFYNVTEDGFDFVLPKPACDPYRGTIRPANLGGVLLNNLVNDVEAVTCEPIEVKHSPSSIESSWYIWQMMRSITDFVSHTSIDIKVKLAESEDYWSQEMTEIERKLSAGRNKRQPLNDSEKLIHLPSDDDKSTATVVLVREPNFFGTVSLVGGEDQPQHPHLEFGQFALVRAYQWLPGKVRKSKDKLDKPPVYQPTPVRLAIAQTVSIRGINPKLTQ